MKKKAALISLYADSTKGIPPLGSLYLATALKKKGVEAKIFHKEVRQFEAIQAEVEAFGPDLIGMSVFTGYLNKEYVDLSKKFKEKGCLIVWGNAHPSLLPHEVLKENYVDFVIIGEGEGALAELAENIGDWDKYSQIKNLGYKDQAGRIHINERREFGDIDEFLIDWSLIDLEEYIVPYFSGRFKRTLAVVSSRGCPFNCQFCYNLVFNNRRWRGHSPENLVINLAPILKQYRVDAIRFLDDNFFVNKARALEIVRQLGLPYSADSRVEYISEELVRELKTTRCLELTFGFESGSDRVLRDVVKKGTGTADIIRAVTLLKGTGIKATAGIVFGMPGETREEYCMTMKFISELLLINSNLAFTCGWFLPYPGTGLYKKAKELGFKPPEKIEDWDRFDRWRDDYDMAWVAWDYSKAVKYSRKLVHLLALAHKRNLPVIKGLLKWRAEKGNFTLPLDIYLFGILRNIYLHSGERNWLNRTVKGIIGRLIKIRKKYDS